MQATTMVTPPSTSKTATSSAAGTLAQTDSGPVQALEEEPSAGEGEPTCYCPPGMFDYWRCVSSAASLVIVDLHAPVIDAQRPSSVMLLYRILGCFHPDSGYMAHQHTSSLWLCGVSNTVGAHTARFDILNT